MSESYSLYSELLISISFISEVLVLLSFQTRSGHSLVDVSTSRAKQLVLELSVNYAPICLHSLLHAIMTKKVFSLKFFF